MDFTISHEVAAGFIRITTAGDIRAEDTGRMAQAGLEVGREVDCMRFLIDYRGAVATDDMVDIYKFMSGLEALGVPSHARMAMAIKRDDDSHLFAETVARNRGWAIRYFWDIDEAERWLVKA